jgi:hypothetical protein
MVLKCNIRERFKLKLNNMTTNYDSEIGKIIGTTIKCMFPYNPNKNRFKYCFEMLNYGGTHRDELELWCEESPTREWGNMGYVYCQTDEDAIEFINTWGINYPRRRKQPDARKQCAEKINGHCPLHNLFCRYPECEK